MTKSGYRVLISGGLATGGVQTHTSALCRILRDAGAEVALAGTYVSWPDRLVEEISGLGVRICAPRGYRKPSGFLSKGLACMKGFLLLKRNFDLVLCLGNSGFHRFCASFAHPEGVKLYNEILPRVNPGSVRFLSKMDAFVGISRYNCADLREKFPNAVVKRLPHIYRAEPIGAALRRPAVGGRQLRLAYIGRLDPWKRPHWLVREWRSYAEQGPVGPARLDIYGADTGQLAQPIQQMVREMNLDSVIAYHGPYDHKELDRILDETDLVLHPSQFEGLGLVLLESMHRGVPVVATEAFGSAELGEENPDVAITPGDHWEEFKAGVMRMAQRIRMGEIDSVRLQRWVEARYGYARLCDEWRHALLRPKEYFGLKRRGE
jgi:glycosyltransferase involved in cell wall biosynthesis